METDAEKSELRAAYRVMQAASGIEVGDTVKVLRSFKSYEMGFGYHCNNQKCKYVGHEAIVDEVDYGIVIGDWSFPFFCLELVSKAPKEAPKEAPKKPQRRMLLLKYRTRMAR